MARGDSTVQNPGSHTYTDPGTYTLSLTVDNAVGPPSTTTKTITVDPPAPPPAAERPDQGHHLRSHAARSRSTGRTRCQEP